MSAAREFIELAMAECGEPISEDLVRIPHTQAELARKFGLSRGTIAKYLSRLNGTVRRVPCEGIYVDRAMLDRMAVAIAEVEHLAPVPRSVTTEVAFLLEAMAQSIATLSALMAPDHSDNEGGAQGRAKGAQSSECAPCAPAEGRAQDAHSPDPAPDKPPGEGPNPGRCGASDEPGFCAPRSQELASFSGSKDQELASYVRAPKGAPAGGAQRPEAPEIVTTRCERLSDTAAIDAALAPLMGFARRCTPPLSTALNDEGRRWLGLYSSAELAHGAAEVLARLKAGKRVMAPIGLIVAMARRGDEAFFAAPPPVPARPAVAEPAVDQEDVEEAWGFDRSRISDIRGALHPEAEAS